MSLPDGLRLALEALKLGFEGKSAVHPALRHVLTETAPEDYLAQSRGNHLRGAEGFAYFVYGVIDDILVREIRGNRHDAVCRTHFFLNDDPDRSRREESFQVFWRLAKRATEVLCESGRLEPVAGPAPGSLVAYKNHWCVCWMEVVYQVACEGRPCGPRVEARSSIRHLPLPGLSTASELDQGVFSASARALDCILTEGGDQAPEAPAVVSTDLVTLDQIAASVHRKKRTLERYKTKGELPDPTVEGGGGRPALWDWKAIRPWLEARFGIRLPETYPANRRHA